MQTIYIQPGWRCTLDLVGRAGIEAAEVDGPIGLEITSGEELGTLTRTGDRQFLFVAGEAEGVISVTATGDADLNDGVSVVSTPFEIVIENQADHISVDATAFASGEVE